VDLFPVVREFVHTSRALHGRLVQAAEVIASQGIPIYLLHWSGDPFVAYPDSLMDQLAQAHVELRPIELPGSGGQSLIDHLRVARNGGVNQKVLDLLQSLSQRQSPTPRISATVCELAVEARQPGADRSPHTRPRRRNPQVDDAEEHPGLGGS